MTKHSVQTTLPTRVDRYLKRILPHLTQSCIQKHLRKGGILVNGKRGTANQRVQEGDDLSVPDALHEDIPEPIQNEKLWQQFESWVVFEDAAMCVINKPYGIATQGGTNIRHSIDDYANSGPHKYHIVHRLDRLTTGLLILAKSPEMAHKLAEQFKERRVRKYYAAIVEVAPPRVSGIIDAPLLKVGEGMQISDQGKTAYTRYRVVKWLDDHRALLVLKPRTGRHHQLRAHLAYIGAPILGDLKYNPASAVKHLHLYAYKIVLEHPHLKPQEFVQLNLAACLSINLFNNHGAVNR